MSVALTEEQTEENVNELEWRVEQLKGLLAALDIYIFFPLPPLSSFSPPLP